MAKAVFVVPGKPQGKARARTVLRSGIMRTYTPEKTENYENWIRSCYMRDCGAAFGTAALRLTVTALYSIPASWSFKRQKAASDGQILPCVKPDADNIMKVVADALNGIAYKDDKQIIEQHFVKRYDAHPRLIVELEDM